MVDNSSIPWVSWLLSLYGAVLSTVLAFLHWQRDKGKFSVSPEVLRINTPFEEKTIVWRVIEIVNIGRRTLYLDDFGFVRESGLQESIRDLQGETYFPLKLEEGQKHRSMTIDDRFASHDIEKLWAKDTNGRVYYSVKLPFGKDQ